MYGATNSPGFAEQIAATRSGVNPWLTSSHVTKAPYVSRCGWPETPQIPGIEHVISSNEALDLPALPKHIVIVGGGYIAVEFAGIFNGFGSEVVEIIRREQVLRGFDEDLRVHLGVREVDRLGDELRRIRQRRPRGGKDSAGQNESSRQFHDSHNSEPQRRSTGR